MADQLNTGQTAMSTSYARKTGNNDAVMALLTDGKDHYFTAAEALADCFIDSITDASPVAAHDLPPFPLPLPACCLAAGWWHFCGSCRAIRF